MGETPQQKKCFPDWLGKASPPKSRGVLAWVKQQLDELIVSGPLSGIRNWIMLRWYRLRWRIAGNADIEVKEIQVQGPFDPPYGSMGVTWCSLYLVAFEIEGRVQLTPEFIRKATRGADLFEDAELVFQKITKFVEQIAPEKYGKGASFLACWYQPPKFVLWEWTEPDRQMTIRAVTPMQSRLIQVRMWRNGWNYIPRPDDWWKSPEVR